MQGIPEDKADYFFNHYNAVGWLDPANRPITSWQSMVLKWKAKGYQYEELKSKQAKADDGMARLRAKYEKENPLK